MILLASFVVEDASSDYVKSLTMDLPTLKDLEGCFLAVTYG